MRARPVNQREKKLECEVCVPWQCLVVQNVVENVMLSGACVQLCQNSIHLRSPGQVSMSGKTVTMLSERTSGSSFSSACRQSLCNCRSPKHFTYDYTHLPNETEHPFDSMMESFMQLQEMRIIIVAALATSTSP